MHFKFREVSAVDGTVAVHVTAYMPLGITKEIHVRLGVEDAEKLIAKTRTVIDSIKATSGASVRRLTT